MGVSKKGGDTTMVLGMGEDGQAIGLRHEQKKELRQFPKGEGLPGGKGPSRGGVMERRKLPK